MQGCFIFGSLTPVLSLRRGKWNEGSPGRRPAIFASLPVHELYKLPADESVRGHHQTKPVVVPLVIWVIVVAVRDACVVRIVVPRAAAQPRGPCPIRQAIRPV